MRLVPIIKIEEQLREDDRRADRGDNREIFHARRVCGLPACAAIASHFQRRIEAASFKGAKLAIANLLMANLAGVTLTDASTDGATLPE